MRYIYKCPSYSWRNIVDMYLPYLTLPTYIVMRGKRIECDDADDDDDDDDH